MYKYLPKRCSIKILGALILLSICGIYAFNYAHLVYAQENQTTTTDDEQDINQQQTNTAPPSLIDNNQGEPNANDNTDTVNDQNVEDNTVPSVNLPVDKFVQNKPSDVDMSIGIAKYYTIEEDVEDGDIISIVDNAYKKSQKTYDVSAIGVVTENPAIEISEQEYVATEKRYPVMSAGTAFVKVTTKNGDIKKGDVLTTSDIPGVAMKADRPGFAIGVSDEDVTNLGDQTKKIKVSLNLHYNYLGQEKGFPDKLTFTDIFAITKLLEYQSPSAVMKYMFAGFVVVVSIIFGYLTFARIASRGIEAVGRNPLASKAINFSIVVNVAITIAIVLAGLTLAYFIIVL